MPYLKTSSGINWFYDLEGKGAPLLFLHGWGVDMRIWRQQVKHFSLSHQVLSLDLPGHGKSSWWKSDLNTLTSDILAVLDQLGWKNLDAVGSSFGGLILLKLSALAPGRIKSLTIVGTLPKFVNSGEYLWGLDPAHIEKLAQQLESDYPAIVNIFFRSLFTRKERESRRFKWLQRFRQNINLPQKQALDNFLDILIVEDLRKEFQNLEIPFQWLNGTDDYICPRKSVEYFKTLRPGLRTVFFEGCGHFPFLTYPHEFNAVLEEFLDA